MMAVRSIGLALGLTGRSVVEGQTKLDLVITGVEGHTLILHATHHCMIDGMSGVDLATILMSTSPNYETPDVYQYMPRPAYLKSK